MPNNFNNIGINIAHTRHPIPPHTPDKKTDVPSGTSACLLSARFSEA